MLDLMIGLTNAECYRRIKAAAISLRELTIIMHRTAFWRRLHGFRSLIERRFLGRFRDYRIGGQRPKVRWRENENGQVRSIEDGLRIAQENGVKVPEDVIFLVAELGELKRNLQGLISTGRPGNFHDLSWDEADKLVYRMRKSRR